MPPPLLGSRRGRLAHRPGCAKLRRGAEPVPDDGMRALCEACFPQCVVCLSAAGWPMPCGHGVCDACMGMHVHHALGAGRTLRCPCEQSAPLDLRADLSDAGFRAWAREMRTRVQELQQHPPHSSSSPTRLVRAGVAVALCEDARARACPHCGSHFVDFDGCAALRCACGSFFCALCLRGFEDSDACHAHVRACPLHPSPGDYYVSMAACDRVWLARARRRVRQSLLRLARVDGPLLAWTAACAVWRRDPPLLAPTSLLLLRVRPRGRCWALACALLQGACVGAALHCLCERVSPWTGGAAVDAAHPARG